MSSSQAISSMLAGLQHDPSHLFIGLDDSNPNIQRWQSEAVGLHKLTGYFTASSNSAVVELPELNIQDRYGTFCICNLLKVLELPVTGNGVVDKDKLVRQFIRHEAGERVAPRNEVERQVAQIWQQVLGIPLLSIHDNFFELGGNSLLAIQVISRVRDIFSLELSLHRLFASPTVAELALILEALETTSGNEDAFFINNTEEYEEGYL